LGCYRAFGEARSRGKSSDKKSRCLFEKLQIDVIAVADNIKSSIFGFCREEICGGGYYQIVLRNNLTRFTDKLIVKRRQAGFYVEFAAISLSPSKSDLYTQI